MPDADMVLVWERWSSGDALTTIAEDFGVAPSFLHQELQRFLEQKADGKMTTWVAA